MRKGQAGQEVKSFIQNVHHFRDEGLNNAGPPADHVVIFDEAQRAWNRKMTADFMKRKKGHPEFVNRSQSSYCPTWIASPIGPSLFAWSAVVRRSIAEKQGSGPGWRPYATGFRTGKSDISPELRDSEYGAGKALDALEGRPHVVRDARLHLAVSVRSFRSENVSRFVKTVLDLDEVGAQEILSSMAGRYPIALTRDLGLARRWLREHGRGSERYGLVVSSDAQRLKPLAIDVRVEVNPIHWFLNGPEDTRSSLLFGGCCNRVPGPGA